VTPETFHLDRPWALLLLLAVPLAVAALAYESRRSPRLPRLGRLAGGLDYREAP